MSVFQFGVENLPPQVSEQWQIARPDKSRALEASKQATLQALEEGKMRENMLQNKITEQQREKSNPEEVKSNARHAGCPG